MDPSILKQFDEINSLMEYIRANDISHDDLGVQHGFHDAEKSKINIIQYLVELIKDSREHVASVNQYFLSKILNEIISHLNSLKGHIGSIEQLSKYPIHAYPQYPQERTNAINSIKNIERSLEEKTHLLELENKLAKLNQFISTSDFLKSSKTEVSTLIDEIKQHSSEGEKILSNLQDKVMKKGITESATNFTKQCDNHKSQETIWLSCFIISAALTLAAFVYVVFVDSAFSESTAIALSKIFKHILIVSAPLLFLKITLSKYNIERNLRIVYDHRQTVLE